MIISQTLDCAEGLIQIIMHPTNENSNSALLTTVLNFNLVKIQTQTADFRTYNLQLLHTIANTVGN